MVETEEQRKRAEATTEAAVTVRCVPHSLLQVWRRGAFHQRLSLRVDPGGAEADQSDAQQAAVKSGQGQENAMREAQGATG